MVTYISHNCVCLVECPEDRYGSECKEKCHCFNGARCDHASGECVCAAGWTGAQCQQGKTLGTTGPKRLCTPSVIGSIPQWDCLYS